MVLAAAASLVGASVQSATGFGFALILGPALFAVLEPREAVTTLLLLGVVLSLAVLFAERRPRRISWPTLAPMLLAAVPGAVGGALVLQALSKSSLQVLVGLAVLAAAAIQIMRAAPVAGVPSPPRRLWPALGVGSLAGGLTTTTSVNGPPLLLWLLARRAEPAELRDSLAAAFLVLDVVGIAAIAALGGGSHVLALGPTLALVPPVAIGWLVGRRLFARLPAGAFRALVLALVVAAGFASIAAGLAA